MCFGLYRCRVGLTGSGHGSFGVGLFNLKAHVVASKVRKHACRTGFKLDYIPQS